MTTVHRLPLLSIVLALIQLAVASCTSYPSNQVTPALCQPATNEPAINVTVDLSDGSHLVGTPKIGSILVQTGYAKMEIPLSQVRTITLEKDHENASLELQNGDKLKGLLPLESLELTTVFGKVAVGPEQILKITVNHEASCLATQTMFNAAKDFATQNNPAGPWSYGWTQTLGAEFQLFQTGRIISDIFRWQPEERAYPVVGIRTREDANRRSSAPIRSEQNWLHPGPKGECAVLRWTATRTGIVKVTGKFTGYSGLTTTDVHIFHQRKEVFTSYVNLQGQGNDSPFDIKLVAQPGDTIDFVVGSGNGSYNDDTTWLDAVIDSVNEMR